MSNNSRSSAPISPPLQPVEAKHSASITKAQFEEISMLLGLNVDSTEQLIARLKQILVVHIEGEPVTFEPGLLTRLKSRCPSNVPFSSWLRAQVKQWAHAYVGW